MSKEKFLLLSLQEEQAKKVTQIVSNKTARQILDLLSDGNLTESQLAERLNAPLPTVHYNVQQLVKAGLVESDEYHYSSKGKEINHYKLANKYIIIAPKSTYGIKEKLKSILPVGIVGIAFAWVVQLLQRSSISETVTFMDSGNSLVQKRGSDTAQLLAEETVQEGAGAAKASAAEAVQSSADRAISQVADDAVLRGTEEASIRSAEQLPVLVQTVTTEPRIGIWIGIGVIVALTLYLLTDYFLFKLKK